MTPDVDGKVVFLTGSANGIGLALRSKLSALGAKVFAVDMAAQKGDSAVTYKADLAREADVKNAVAACRRALGPIDNLLHVAGRIGRGPLTEMSLKAWREEIAVNLTSAFLLAREAYGDLRQTKGSVVFVSSPNGVHGGTTLSGPAYASAKAGLVNLTRYLAKEWAGDGIRVNCLVPGTVATPMLDRLSDEERESLIRSIPLGRLGTADEMADAVLFLAASAPYMTGATLNVTGGRLM